MLDAGDYFRLWLLSLSGVVALVTDRVFSEPLPFETAHPAVSYFCKSSPVGGDVPMQEVSATVYCWGRTEDEAKALYGVLFSALHATGGETARVGGQVLSGLSIEGQEMTDQDLELHQAWYTKCEVVFAMGA